MPNALGGYTRGSALINYREFQFGPYVFPLTMQEQTRLTKLKSQRQIIPYQIGEYISPTTMVGAREITLVGAMGTGLVGTNNNTLATAADLETERSILAALQALGRQQLFATSDRYCNAFLDSFEHKFFQDGGVFRYADWTLKFIADDPRYFSTVQHTVTESASDAYSHQLGGYPGAIFNQLGSTRCFPMMKFVGKCTAPQISVIYGSGITITVTFSKLTMNAGDTLVIDCDPRPEHRSQCAIYTPSGGTPVNALQYCAPATDFANNYDARYVFPFIEPSSVNSTQIVQYYNINSSSSYTFSLIYNDTWL